MILKKPALSDLEALYKLFSKEEVNKYNPAGPAKDISEIESVLESWLNDWQAENIGYYIARTRLDNAFIGYMGVAYRQFLGKKILNLAYRIEPDFWRKGYTIEGVTAILAKINSDGANEVVKVLTKSNNTPSIAVAKKLGFVYNEKYDNYPDQNDVYYFNVSKRISDELEK